jgi:hypothetical protein
MNHDNTTDNQNDDGGQHTSDESELQALLLAEVPDSAAGYWEAIDQLVDDAAASDPVASESTTSVLAGAAGSIGAPIDISSARNAGVDEHKRTFISRLGWPAAVAATLLLLVGLVAVVGNRRSQNSSDLATNADNDLAINGDGPEQNLDHWHAVYGVWDCTLADGAGDWLPHFESNRDGSGIHSHGDGLIHIHPFYEWSADENAQLGLFATEMQVELSDDALVLDDGRRLAEGATTCDGEPVTLHLRHWDLDFRALQGDAPQIITEELASARFRNDREVWVLAYAPLDAEVPLPPQERFNLMNAVTAPVEYNPDALPPEGVPSP